MTHEPHLFEGFPFYLKSRNEIIHYTCNAPSREILEKNNLESIGKLFGSDGREILRIPLAVYNKYGFSEIKDKNILKINSEIMMRKLK